MTIDERNTRRYKRVPVSIRVSPEGGFPDDALDLSAGGFRVQTARPLPLGACATFHLDLPRGEPVAQAGEVVWSARDGFGVRFTGPIDPRLSAYVDKLVKDSERL